MDKNFFLNTVRNSLFVLYFCAATSGTIFSPHLRPYAYVLIGQSNKCWAIQNEPNVVPQNKIITISIIKQYADSIMNLKAPIVLETSQSVAGQSKDRIDLI